MVYAHTGSSLVGTLLINTMSRKAAINALKKAIRFKVVLLDYEFKLSDINLNR